MNNKVRVRVGTQIVYFMYNFGWDIKILKTCTNTVCSIKKFIFFVIAMYCILSRAGNSVISCLSESLVFLQKNERLSHSLKKMSDSLMVAHFWWATWVNCSWSLIFGEWPERFAYSTHFRWATWAIRSHSPLKKREWAIRSRSLICLEWSERITHSRSFDLSKMSKWTNEQWAMSEWPNFQPWF